MKTIIGLAAQPYAEGIFPLGKSPKEIVTIYKNKEGACSHVTE